MGRHGTEVGRRGLWPNRNRDSRQVVGAKGRNVSWIKTEVDLKGQNEMFGLQPLIISKEGWDIIQVT